MKTVLEPEHAEVQAQEASLISLFSDWVQQGTENFFAAQRILLDLVMRQNTMAMDALRERLTDTGPGTALLKEAGGEGFANFIAAQKILLDLAQRQNKIVMTGVKERVGASTPAGAMADLLRRGVETFIDLQEHFLDTAAKQGKAWMDTAETGTAFQGKGLGEFARESMESFIHSQKNFLDVIAEETAKATKEVKGAHRHAEKTSLTDLARHSVDAFVEAQKKLLATTGDQLDVSVKAASKAAAALTPASDTSLAELTRRGLDNFVAAQKALLDVMVKPVPAPHRAHTRS